MIEVLREKEGLGYSRDSRFRVCGFGHRFHDLGFTAYGLGLGLVCPRL